MFMKYAESKNTATSEKKLMKSEGIFASQIVLKTLNSNKRR